MFTKLFDPIKQLVNLLKTLRKVVEKKLTVQTINLLVILWAATIVILSSQLFVALLVIRVLGL